MNLNFASATEMPGVESAQAQPPPSIEEIARHFPQLELIECLGRGGMGVVYKARQPNLNRLVGLKILAPERERDPAFAERFTHEARALAKLSHPNIVAIYDAGVADGMFYLLMEFVDGMNLRELLDVGRITPREALAVVPQICDALQYAHDAGIVHRDIKPENILLDRRGRVKVADFGLAKLVEQSGPGILPVESGAATSATGTIPASPDLTAAGQVLGTPQYMAPEQVSHPSEVDHRADIYSLGVVFYQMLTGELPKGDFAPPSKRVVMDVRLDEVVLRALEKRPELRYQQVSDVKTMIETIVTTSGGAKAEVNSSFLRTTIAGLSWCTRILGTLMLLIWLMFLLGEGVSSRGPVEEGVRVEFLGMFLMLLGFVIGWKWEGWAALAILAGALEFHIVEWKLWLPGMLEWPTVVGLLYGVCWWLRKSVSMGKTGTADSQSSEATPAGRLPLFVKHWRRIVLVIALFAGFALGNRIGSGLSQEARIAQDIFLVLAVFLILFGKTLKQKLFRGVAPPVPNVGKTAPADSQTSENPGQPSSGENAKLALARQQVKGPATAMMGLGVLNSIAIPAVLIFVVIQITHNSKVGGPMGSAILFLIMKGIAELTLNTLMMFGAWKMKRLESFEWARVAAILCISVSTLSLPLLYICFLVSIPLGVWALVVLHRPDVRAAFSQPRSQHAEPPVPKVGKPGPADSQALEKTARSKRFGKLRHLGEVGGDESKRTP